MDPEATLSELRTLGAKIIRSMDSDQSDESERDDCARFVELFQALDEWRINGGFLPAVWARP